MNKLTKMGYLNTAICRLNAKDLPSKIKHEGNNNTYNNEILIQNILIKKYSI